MPQKTEDVDWTYFKNHLAKTVEGKAYNAAWVRMLESQKILAHVLANRTTYSQANLAAARHRYIKDSEVAGQYLEMIELKYGWPRQ